MNANMRTLKIFRDFCGSLGEFALPANALATGRARSPFRAALNSGALLLLVCLLLAGCGGANDASEEKNPHIRKGLEQVQLKNWGRAEEQFETALTKNPELARPDLELALIYHQYKKDYIRAVYHYERYLEKRPATEKRPLILSWIRQAKISLAAETAEAAGDISEELVRLTRENNLLRRQLDVYQGKAAPVQSVTTVKTLADLPPPAAEQLESVAEPEPTPVSPQPVERIQISPPPVRTYTVRPGDTLTRIAKSAYGDASKWRKIYEANKSQMRNENDLKAGQTILLPPAGN